MKNRTKKNDKLFASMRENYLLAQEHLPDGFKSKHWDVFDREFVRFFDNHDVWERMLRNQLTLGLNDNLAEISNRRFLDKKDNLWQDLRRGKIKDVIFEKHDDKRFQQEINHLKAIVAHTDLKYVIENCLTDVGSPVITRIKVALKGSNHIINYNIHDMSDLYHSWLILEKLNQQKSHNPIICEIGGGYGGLASKIKSNIKGAKIMMFDLPEVNAYQTFYLSKVFDGAVIKGYKEFSEQGICIFEKDFDFLILPGWVINQLPRASVDHFINIRSMMEMNKENLEFYFRAIQTSIRIDGTFSCFNRYSKLVGEFKNRLKLYPFDNDWQVLLSKPSVFQPHIHQFILQRKNNSHSNFRQNLQSIIKDS